MTVRHAPALLMLGSLALGSATALAATPTEIAGSQQDPSVRAAQYLSGDRRHFSALVELLRVEPAGESKLGPARSDEYWRLLADNYISFGVAEPADEILKKQQPKGRIEQFEVARQRLRLARFQYERGYHAEARNGLVAIRDQLPKELRADWMDLMSRVTMAAGDWAGAVSALTAFKASGQLSPYMRYNLGISQIRVGSVEQGRNTLDDLGRSTASDRDTLALRDRANLMLGWHLLQDGNGAAAKPIFSRIGITGLYSNRALLGLGWAEIAPYGDRKLKKDAGQADSKPVGGNPFGSFSALGRAVRRGFVDDLLRVRSSNAPGDSNDQEKALRAALAAWLQLIDRDSQDPAVQEAWLAVPYVLAQLGARQQAQQYYEQGAERLETALKRNDIASKSLQSGSMLESMVRRDVDAESGWTWEVRDLPDLPETYYLQSLLAEHRFAEGLKNYRDVRMMMRNLDAWNRRLDDAEKAYNSPERASVDTGVLFRRAKESGNNERPAVNIKLANELNLTEPGRYKKTLRGDDYPTPQLALAAMPQGFKGTWEDMQGLRSRLSNLKEQLSLSGVNQRDLLQQTAADELAAQRKQIQKYLVEARFALARLYDRSSNALDPDEKDIK